MAGTKTCVPGKSREKWLTKSLSSKKNVLQSGGERACNGDRAQPKGPILMTISEKWDSSEYGRGGLDELRGWGLTNATFSKNSTHPRQKHNGKRKKTQRANKKKFPFEKFNS